MSYRDGEPILLVEDDPEQAELLLRWLEVAGYSRAVHADNGHLAADLLRERQWAIVVSDIDLPGLSGLELLRLSKQLHPFTPALLITAHDSIDYVIEALRGGADDIFIKPLEKETFLTKVQYLIEKADSERLQRQLVVLAIGAHPDDVEIGVGGILLKHFAAGDRVTILTLTGGEEGGAKAQRIAESQRAATLLGATLIMSDLEDARVSEGQETISIIQQVVNAINPAIVYTHSVNDGHQDHRSAYRATIVAARGIPNVFCYQTPSTDIDFRPSVFSDIGDYLERKIEAVNTFSSQVAIRPYLKESLTRSTAEYWGRFAGYGLVEPLEVVRQKSL